MEDLLIRFASNEAECRSGVEKKELMATERELNY